MKKITKRILALFLAALIFLGAGTVAGAAAPSQHKRGSEASGSVPRDLPACTLEITTPPANTTFVLYEGWPSLDGLVFEASGGNLGGTVTVDYDTVANDRAQAQDKIIWWFGLDYYRLAEGENDVALYVEAYKCTEFVPVKTVDGIEYGYFDTQYVFGAYTTFTVTIEADPNYPGTPRVLALDVAETICLDRPDEGGYYGGGTYEFTAPSDGYYAFRSDGGSYGETLYSQDGDVLATPYIDPWVSLYDENYNWDFDDDSGGNYNFAIYRQMRQGEVVSLEIRGWASEEASFTVKITRVGDTQPVLRLKSNEIKVVFHDFIDIDALLEGTGYGRWDVRLSYDWNYINDWYYNPHSVKTGTTYLTITAPDGSAAAVKVTIGYSAAQWLCYVLLGGWAWLGYTEPGPFNLMREIRNLLGYGVGNSLRDLFADWVYALYRWLRNY